LVEEEAKRKGQSAWCREQQRVQGKGNLLAFFMGKK
jgi:hypothetical protein